MSYALEFRLAGGGHIPGIVHATNDFNTEAVASKSFLGRANELFGGEEPSTNLRSDFNL